jgi:hypothetical protein
MKKVIFAYVIVAFLLTSFTDCRKIVSNLGLKLSGTSNSSEVVERPNISNEIENFINA